MALVESHRLLIALLLSLLLPLVDIVSHNLKDNIGLVLGQSLEDAASLWVVFLQAERFKASKRMVKPPESFEDPEKLIIRIPD